MDANDPFADAIPSAIKYLNAGWGIVPAWSPRLDAAPRADGQHPCSCPKGATCDSPGKHPAIPKAPSNRLGFAPYFLASEDAIRTALSNPGTRNYLMVPPPDVVVADLDAEALALWNHKRVELGSPGETLTTRTANGFHAAYALAPEDDPGGNLFGRIVTRRYPGGGVIGPGSVHPTGVPYVNGGPMTINPFAPPWRDALKSPEARPAHQSVPVGEVEVGNRHDWLRDEALTFLDRQRLFQRTPEAEERLWAHMSAYNAALAQPKDADALRKAVGDPWAALTPHPVITLAPKPVASIGSRTANDLPIGPPPELICGGYLVPDNTTLMYGTGGTGKGVIAAVFVAMLVREYGLTVMVIDYEDHPDEWGRRLDGLTFADGSRLTADEKARVLYRSPYDVGDWTADTGSLHAVAMALRADCEALGVDYVVVDSYTAASDGEEGMGGQRDAANFARAITRVGRPALVLAHVADTGDRLPDKPFGSVFVRNLVARLMYAMAQDRQTDDAQTGSAPLIAPVSIRVETRRTKGNNYGRRANRWIEVTFHPGGAITWDLDAMGTVPALWEQVEGVLTFAAPTPMTPEAILKAVSEDWPRDRPLKVNAIREVLSRHRAVFTIADGMSRPKTWTVRGTRAQHHAPYKEGGHAALASEVPSAASAESERSIERSMSERGAQHSAQHGFEEVSAAWSERGSAASDEPPTCVDPKAHKQEMAWFDGVGMQSCRTCRPGDFIEQPPQPQ